MLVCELISVDSFSVFALAIRGLIKCVICVTVLFFCFFFKCAAPLSFFFCSSAKVSELVCLSHA